MPTAYLIPIRTTPRTLETCDRCGRRQHIHMLRQAKPFPSMFLDPVHCETVCSECAYGPTRDRN